MGHCCEPFTVFGIEIEAPANHAFYGAQHIDQGLGVSANDKFWGMDSYVDPPGLRGNPGWNNLDGFTGIAWTVYAAKVPPYYPYQHCEKWPPTSSADPRASESWKVQIGVGLELVDCFGLLGNGTVDDPGPVMKRFIARPVYGSHAIYEDGEQRYIVYVHHSDWNRDTYDPESDVYYSGRPFDWLSEARESWGKHVIIDIAAQTVVGTFNASWLDGDATGSPQTIESTAMRQSWVNMSSTSPQTLNLLSPWIVNSSSGLIVGADGPGCFAAHQHQFGLKHYAVSNYMPATARAATIPDDLAEWDVGRLAYEGYVVFCTGTRNSGLTDRVRTGKSHVGDYAIMLPAVRQDIVTSDDESVRWLPWVVARKYNSETQTWKLVTGRWGNSDLRPSSGIDTWPSASPGSHADDLTHAFADGSLREAEVENTIYEGPDQPEVYCYNRIRGKDYVVFALLGVPTGDNTSSPTADFEPDSMGERGDLQHGLPDGVVFTTRGEHGGGWQTDNTVYYTDPGTYMIPDTTKWGSKSNSSPTFQGLVLQEIEINVAPTSTGDLEFDWRLDNRATNPGFPHALLNLPADDGSGNHDTFELWIDTVPVLTKDGTDFSVGTPDDWSTFHHFKLSTDAPASVMTAGKHKIAFVFRRYTAANFQFPTFAAVDDVKFFGISTADEEGSPHYFDGTTARPIIHQIRPARESDVHLLDRATSVPHYITLDREDRIWYGNPHGEVRLKADNIGKDHDIRFTAMPGEPMPTAPFRQDGQDPDFATDIDDPTPGYKDVCTLGSADHSDTNTDVSGEAYDPPHGAFQLMPSRKEMQNRGANASIRDASGLPVDLDSDPNHRYRYELTAGPGTGTWAKRCHAFSISYDGGERLPHVEIAFRIGMSAESYPWTKDYIDTHFPPFAANVYDTDWGSGWHFQFLIAGETLPPDVHSGDTCHTAYGTGDDKVIDTETPKLDGRVDDRSFIISRAYTTATSKMPAYRWLFNPNDDPTGDDAGAWDTAHEPYPSARAVIYPIYWPGVSRMILDTRTMSGSLALSAHGNFRCVQTVDRHLVVDHYVCDITTDSAWYLQPNTVGNPEANFDAVDCDCDCCEEAADFELENRQSGFDPPADEIT